MPKKHCENNLWRKKLTPLEETKLTPSVNLKTYSRRITEPRTTVTDV